MGFREAAREFLKAHAEGEIRQTILGGSVYRPAGWRIRLIGDSLAGLGTVGFVMPAISPRTHYAVLFPGLTVRESLAVFAAVPLVAAVFIWWFLTLPGWKSRAATAVIGIVGTVLTGHWAWQWIGPAVPPAWDLGWIGVGSVLVMVGGITGALAAFFGEWAKRYDTGI